MKRALVPLLMPLLLGGCFFGSAAESYPPLDEVALEIQRAEKTSIPTLAPAAYQEAVNSLDRARASLEDGEEDDLRHLTYMTRTRLEIARALADAAAARSERDMLRGVRAEILQAARERAQLSAGPSSGNPAVRGNPPVFLSPDDSPPAPGGGMR